MKFEKILPHNWQYGIKTLPGIPQRVDIIFTMGFEIDDKEAYALYDYLKTSYMNRLIPKLTFHQPLDLETPYHNTDLTFDPFTCPNCLHKYRIEVKKIE